MAGLQGFECDQDPGTRLRIRPRVVVLFEHHPQPLAHRGQPVAGGFRPPVLGQLQRADPRQGRRWDVRGPAARFEHGAVERGVVGRDPRAPVEQRGEPLPHLDERRLVPQILPPQPVDLGELHPRPRRPDHRGEHDPAARRAASAEAAADPIKEILLRPPAFQLTNEVCVPLSEYKDLNFQ